MIDALSVVARCQHATHVSDACPGGAANKRQYSRLNLRGTFVATFKADCRGVRITGRQHTTRLRVL